ncbi:MAG TPA: DUF1572 family protein [Bacteroidia bacterium]|nr:DUF1572 family protein [Bacteroidia bacterium]
MVSSGAEKQFLENALFEFSRMKKSGDAVLSRLNEKEIDFSFSANDNSVRVIVQHMAGNLLSRWTDFLTSDGEKSWRNRDAEFEAQALAKAELVEKWEEGWKTLFSALENLTEKDVLREVTIRNEKLTVMQAIFRQISHYAYHTGQLVLIAKHIRGEEWQSLTIPKGKSAEAAGKGTYLSKP